eukprot:m.45583 g.45583  ORF g.45583 m.45583 type:complete len:105 (-) comp15140_c0_seq1:297-611(-)
MGKVHEYAKRGDIEAMKEVLPVSSMGRFDAVNEKDKSGSTPILLATKEGHLNAVKFLIECQAAVDCSGTDGKSPVHWASYNDNDELLRLLVNVLNPPSQGDSST